MGGGWRFDHTNEAFGQWDEEDEYIKTSFAIKNLLQVEKIILKTPNQKIVMPIDEAKFVSW